MKISDLIIKLNKIKEEHGDLLIHVNDGLDPSDFMELDYVEVKQSQWDKTTIVTLTC